MTLGNRNLNLTLRKCLKIEHVDGKCQNNTMDVTYLENSQKMAIHVILKSKLFNYQNNKLTLLINILLFFEINWITIISTILVDNML